MAVAMNPQTWDKDLAEVDAGGYVFYDSTKPLPPSKLRADVTPIGVPLTAICNAEYSDPRQRQLFKNIVYLGALSALLDIEPAEIERLFGEQYKGKEALLASNVKALHMGRDYTLANFECPLPVHVKRSNRSATGSSSTAIPHRLWAASTVARRWPRGIRSRLPRRWPRRSAAIAASCAPTPAPARSATRSCRPRTNWRRSAWSSAPRGMARGRSPRPPGPGVSLMQEFLGLAYFAEIPAVLFDVQRGSPSTGMPTRTQQADLLCCAYASHGDTKHVLLFPEDPTESFEFAATAFDLADRLQTPIFVMLDLDIGMQDWLTEPLAWDDARRMDRGKVMTAEMLDAGRDFGRYLDADGDGVPYRTYPGTHASKGGYFTRGTTKDRYARYTEEGPAYVDNMQRLQRKFETAKDVVPAPVIQQGVKPAKSGVIWFGSTGAAMSESLVGLEAEGIRLDQLRIRAFPFADAIADFIHAHEHVFVVEQNRDAQMKSLLVNECGIDPAKLISILHYDGTPVTARFITREIAEKARLFNVVPMRKVAP
jgi:2-oxoglutarate ferredoxin oxidoreductase subunit alpha